MNLPITIVVTKQGQPPPVDTRQYWRVNHDVYNWRDNLPEVFRIYPFHHVVINEPRQWLLRNCNPRLTRIQIRKLYDNHLAFTNGTGMPDGADYVNRIDIGNRDPRFDQARVCGGAIVSGLVSWSAVTTIQEAAALAGKVVKRAVSYEGFRAVARALVGQNVLNLDCIDTRRPLPTAAEVLARPDWHFEAVNIDWTPDGAMIRPLKGLWGVPVFIPIWVSQNSYLPVSMLTKLPVGQPLPSPYQYP
jgi:hypothetical protein